MCGRLVVAGMVADGSFTALSAFNALLGSTHLAAASLIGIIGMNTVVRLCPDCKTACEYEIRDEDMLLMGISEPKLRGYESDGCESCNHTGTLDRILITETLEVSEKIRSGIGEGIPLRQPCGCGHRGM